MNLHQKRENISDYFIDEKSIHDYIHPRKRGRIELLRRMFIPVFQKKRNLALYLIYALASGLIPLIGAFSIRHIVQIVEELETMGSKNMEECLPLFLIVGVYGLGLLVLSVLVSQVRGIMNGELMYLRLEEMRKLFFKITSSDLSVMEDARVINSFGNYYNCVANSSSGMEGIWQNIFEHSGYFVSFLFLSVLLGNMSPILPALSILAIGLTAVGDYLYNAYLSEKTPEIEKNNRTFFAFHAESQDFSYGKDIRVFDLGDSFKRLGIKLLTVRKKLQKELIHKKGRYKLFKAVAFGVVEVSILYIILKKYEMNAISLPEVLMFLSIAGLFYMQMLGISNCLSYVYRELVSLQYYFDVTDAKLCSEGGRDMDLSEFPNLDIQFQDVWFRYPNSGKFVLEGVNLEIKEGERLALVGVNGAGKSTLTNLLNGLYMPTKGRILIGGIDINELSKKTLNKLMAVVFQDFEPLAMSVKENVMAVNENGAKTDENVVSALEKAGIYDKISSFPKGIYSTMLRVLEDDGMVLSGGENQKIAIARALYKKDSSIMILDEPTSALDALAEEKIYKEFEDMMGEKSAIFISHRLASTRFCDKIALLNGGKIEEVGTHEELLSKAGLYQKMFNTQASYYQEEEDEK